MQLRFQILLLIFGVVVIVWTLYLFAVQILDPHDLEYMRQLRYNPYKEITIPSRGNIYDRNEELLVSSVKYYQIDIDLNSLKKFSEKTHKNYETVLNGVLDIVASNSQITKEDLVKKISNKRAKSVFLSNQIKESELSRIMAKLVERDSVLVGDKKSKKYRSQEKYPKCIISSFSSMKRIYSKGSLAARVLGMVRERTDEGADLKARSIYKMEGFTGVEATYDNLLKGQYGWKEIINDANHNQVPYPNLQEKKPQNGYSMILTIDSNIQEILENNLQAGIEKYNAKNAIGVIMNPNTGEIIAMAGISAEDKNSDLNRVRALVNLPITFMFEPGSTFKPFTALLALDHNIFKPWDKIDCTTYYVGNRTIKDSHKYSTLSFRDIIAYSSNVGISKVVERIGSRILYDRLISLGFGHKSGLNMFGESSGILRKLSDWQGYSLHSISFGQEIAVTALQLTNAYCTLSNGGKVMKPVIVKQMKDENGKLIEEFKPKVMRSVSDEKSLDTLKIFLKNVVDYGTATGTKLDYVTIGGKTGTAEKMIEGTRGYSAYKYTSCFVGLFPVENPQYVMSIIYDEPDYVYHFGSMSSVPTFRKTVEEIIALPSCKLLTQLRSKKQEMITVPDLTGMKLADAEARLNQLKILYQLDMNNPDGYVINQYPKSNVSFNKNSRVVLVIDKEIRVKEEMNNDSTMPNFVGKTARVAIKTALNRRINLKINGSGTIYAQSIPPGTKVKYDEQCQVSAK